MPARTPDGSAGDADYATIGPVYPQHRRQEPRIAALITEALGDARTVLNVGAGAGSYEPRDREVTAVEPSASMRARRPADLPVAIDATAEHLPFPDDAFDAAMSTFSVHQWADLDAGLGELRRVTTGPIVLLTGDPDRIQDFWLNDYAPEILATEARRYPPLATITTLLGGDTTITHVEIPNDCVDGFNQAYYGRPELLLEPDARQACSSWSLVGADVVARFTEHLRRDLAEGTWDRRHGHLRTQPTFDGALVLITSHHR